MHSSSILFLSNLFSSDMIIIVFVALLLFGGEKLPEIARGLGKGIRDFKDASEGVKREINNQINSFEEKREEEKRIEQATAVNQQPEQNQLAAHAEPSTSGIGPAENTMPVNENHFSAGTNNEAENTLPVNDSHLSAGTNNEAENKEAVNAEMVTENHSNVPHKNTGTQTV
jgi:sec-independent protein translocase protein TatA